MMLNKVGVNLVISNVKEAKLEPWVLLDKSILSIKTVGRLSQEAWLNRPSGMRERVGLGCKTTWSA